MKFLGKLFRATYSVGVVLLDPEYLIDLEGRVDRLSEALDRTQHQLDKQIIENNRLREDDNEVYERVLAPTLRLARYFGPPGWEDPFDDYDGTPMVPVTLDRALTELYRLSHQAVEAYDALRQGKKAVEEKYQDLRTSMVRNINPLLDERKILLAEKGLNAYQDHEQAFLKLHDDYDILESDKEDLEHRVEELERELEELLGENEELVAKCEYLEDYNQELSEDLSSLSARNAENVSKIISLEERLRWSPSLVTVTKSHKSDS